MKAKKDPERTERSRIEGIPLLIYPGEPENFQQFERAWIAHAEATYPYNGRCFSNGAYDIVEVPTKENQKDALDLFETSQQKEVMKGILERFLKQEEKRHDEKRLVHGALLSVMSMRSRDIVRASNAEVLSSNTNPLALWQEILKTHKSGTHHLSTNAGRIKLMEDLMRCKQRQNELAEEFAQRFKTVATAYADSLPEGAKPENGFLAHQFCKGINPLRHPRFVEEIMRREATLAPLPATVDAAVSLIQSCSAAEAMYTGRSLVDAVAYSTSAVDKSQKRCFKCGKLGHFKKDCRSRKQSTQQSPSPSEKVSISTVTVNEEPIEEVYIDVRVAVAETGKLYLDSGASHHIVSDPSVVRNIRQSNKMFIVRGFNGAVEKTRMIADCPHFGEVVFTANSTKNLLSLGALSKKRSVQLSYDGGIHFLVQSADGPERVRFDITDNNLFVCDLSKAVSTAGTNMAENSTDSGNTYAAVENVMVAADLQVAANPDRLKRAQAARRAEVVMGYPSPGALAFAVRSGAIKNAPFQSQDVAFAEKILGPDHARIKGKATKPKLVKNVLEADGEIATEKLQELHADVFHLEGKHFLMSMMVPLGQLFATEVHRRRDTLDCIQAATLHIGLCRSHGFEVTRLIVDQESTLVSLIGKIPTVVVPVATGQHVQRAERMIRHVKDRCRAHLNGLPYALPGRCIPMLVTFVVQRINVIPRKSTGPIAPNELFTQRRFDYAIDGIAPFGAMVRADEPTNDNSMAPRSRFCLLMAQETNLSQNWILFDIWKGTFISRASFSELPITNNEIKKLNDWAAKDKTSIGSAFETDDDFQLPDSKIVIGKQRDPITTTSTKIPPELDENRLEPEVNTQPETPAPSAIDAAEPQEAPPTSGFEVTGSFETPEEPLLRKSNRLAGKHVEVYHMFASEARAKHGELASESANEELREILDREVLQPLRPEEVPPEAKPISSFLFYKPKHDAEGNLLKLKARLVATDSSEESALNPNKSSPTVRLESVLGVLSIAAAEGRSLAVMDIGNAYLEASVGNEKIFVQLDRSVSHAMIKLRPSMATFRNDKGRIVAKLNKALYGCVVSAKLWYEHMSGILRALGFRSNPYDVCVFNKTHDGRQITVCLYVDDLLVTSQSKALTDWLNAELSKKFKKVKFNSKERLEFLGLEITQREGQIDVSMAKYTAGLLEEWGGSGKDSSPAGPDLFRSSENSKRLDYAGSEIFQRRTARLLFLAKRVAPEILLAVSYLQGRGKAPTEDDLEKLDRVYRYLNANRTHALTYWRGGKIEISAYIDASHASHTDFKGRTGCILLCAGGFMGAWSTKQSINTKSSSESELVGLSDECGWAIWARNFLQGQGYKTEPATIYQDNTAVADILKRGPSAQLKTRHLSIRYFFVADKIKMQEVIVRYCPTGDMIADILTKPLVGEQFAKLRNYVVRVN
jgi:hypothetical protein